MTTSGKKNIHYTKESISDFGSKIQSSPVLDVPVVPVGSIIAYNPGYYTNGSNAGFTVIGPSTNTIAGIKTYLASDAVNWYVCDGTAPNDVLSPIWNVAGRFVPNLTGDRFLKGSIAVGAIGGQSSVTLATTNLPSHNHTINHDHAAANTGNQSASHRHSQQNAGGGYNGADVNATNFRSVNIGGSGVNSSFQDTSHTHSFNMPAYSGSSGNAGSGTSFSIVPVFLNTVYIIRIK